MDKEPEMIRREMEETRQSLSEKLEALERRTIGTVHEAICTAEKTVASVKQSVRDTVESVTESVHQTVETVRDQVHQHPWAMLGGAVVFGYCCGRLLDRASEGRTLGPYSLSSTNGRSTARVSHKASAEQVNEFAPSGTVFDRCSAAGQTATDYSVSAAAASRQPELAP